MCPPFSFARPDDVRGSSLARRGAGVGTATHPGTRASGGARPTGNAFSAEASSREGPSWVELRSTRRSLGCRGESRHAGVARCPTHGGCFHRRSIQSRGSLVGRASLDAARAWAPRRIQARGRRAVPDPRGTLSAPRHPVARVRRGSSFARRGAGLGAATNPGTRASGGARPTGVVFSAEESSREGPSWVELRSTRRWLGRSDGSRSAGVGRSPTHGGCFHRRSIQSRGSLVGRASLDAARAWAPRRIQARGRRAVPDPRGLLSAPGGGTEARFFVGRAAARLGDSHSAQATLRPGPATPPTRGRRHLRPRAPPPSARTTSPSPAARDRPPAWCPWQRRPT